MLQLPLSNSPTSQHWEAIERSKPRRSQAGKSKKRPNFSSQEIEELTNQVERHRHILEKNDKVDLQRRLELNRTWVKISLAVNSVSNVDRTGYELRKKWENYKSEKKMKEGRRQLYQHVPIVPHLSGLEQRGISIMGPTTIESVTKRFDSDSNRNDPDVQIVDEFSQPTNKTQKEPANRSTPSLSKLHQESNCCTKKSQTDGTCDSVMMMREKHNAEMKLLVIQTANEVLRKAQLELNILMLKSLIERSRNRPQHSTSVQ